MTKSLETAAHRGDVAPKQSRGAGSGNEPFLVEADSARLPEDCIDGRQ